LKLLAPIVLFVYNRPWHTKQTIEALQKNELASESEFIIYSDAAKNEQASQGVEAVRKYIETINGFKKVTLIKRDKNWGLADSIINGVTEVVNKYEKIIVLEDDLVTSPFFLNFMNEALEFYQNNKKVWHVSGWNYPINSEGLNDVFLWRVMNCWGWATWEDKWQFYEKNIDSAMAGFSESEIKAFNLDEAEDFFAQIEANKQRKINTWAIFWYATIFKNNGLCLNPVHTFVDNIGHDGSGVHCGDKGVVEQRDLNLSPDIGFVTDLVESKTAVTIIKNYYFAQKKTLWSRLINKLSRVLTGKNLVS